jgi:hypothetical protein
MFALKNTILLHYLFIRTLFNGNCVLLSDNRVLARQVIQLLFQTQDAHC